MTTQTTTTNAARDAGQFDIFPDATAGEITIGIYGPNAPLVNVVCTIPGINEKAWEYARLIAAAPALLEALRNCLSALETHYVAGEKLSDHYPGRIEAARDAINRAEGGES